MAIRHIMDDMVTIQPIRTYRRRRIITRIITMDTSTCKLNKR